MCIIYWLNGFKARQPYLVDYRTMHRCLAEPSLNTASNMQARTRLWQRCSSSALTPKLVLRSQTFSSEIPLKLKPPSLPHSGLSDP